MSSRRLPFPPNMTPTIFPDCCAANEGDDESDDVPEEPEPVQHLEQEYDYPQDILETPSSEFAKCSINPSCIAECPDPEYFKFDMTCVICWMDSALSSSYCSEGHVTCDCCLDKEVKTCMASVEGGECGAPMKEVDEALKNTPYYQYYMNNVLLKCGGAEIVDCPFVGIGVDLRRHEMVDCPSRFIRYCGVKDCSAVFHDLDNHIAHLCEVHGMPQCSYGQGKFFVKFDRKEFLEVDGCLPSNVVPNMRAIIHAGTKHHWFSVILLAKDMQVETRKFIRVWFCAFYETSDHDLEAKVIIASRPSEVGYTKEFKKPFEIRKIVPVLPTIKASYLDSPPKGYYFDLPNETLDTICVTRSTGEKYFILEAFIDMINRETDQIEFPDQLELKLAFDSLFFEYLEVEQKIYDIMNAPYSLYAEDEEVFEEESRKLIELKDLRRMRNELARKLTEEKKKMDIHLSQFKIPVEVVNK